MITIIQKIHDPPEQPHLPPKRPIMVPPFQSLVTLVISCTTLYYEGGTGSVKES